MNSICSPLCFLARPAGFEPAALRFVVMLRGGYVVWCCLLMFIIVRKLHFKAQYHFAVLCLVLSWSLYSNCTAEGERGLKQKEFLIMHTRIPPFSSCRFNQNVCISYGHHRGISEFWGLDGSCRYVLNSVLILII